VSRQDRQKYEKFSRQLDEFERTKDKKLFNRVKRKLSIIVKGEDKAQEDREMKKRSQRVLSGKHYTLLKRVEELEKYMNKGDD
tara:strand:- start:731 stop:979 length:249 start_codon:yes stop_codon:yes gene_type:complete